MYFCSTMQYIVWTLLIYLLYRFITGFLWPVYKATSMVKKQFKAAKEHMNGQNGNSNVSAMADQNPKFDPGGEYIPFEDLKEK